MNNETDSSANPSFRKKVGVGTVWVTANNMVVRTLRMITAIILARILVPEDFGLMAIAMSVLSFSQRLTETGFESALIQKPHVVNADFNSAWTIDLIRNLVLFAIVFSTAPLIARFFDDPRATLILQVTSLVLVLQGVSNIGVVYFRKELNFKKQFIFDTTPVVVNIFVALPLALILRNVWALVWANVISSVSMFLLSYFMHPYRPKIDFNMERLKELFNFGKWILGSNILVMLRNQGITMFIGKYLGIPVLGLYNRATTFSMTVFQQIVSLVWKIGYPAYSHLQENTNKIKNAALKTLKLLAFIAIPLTGGLFLFANDFVHFLLTDKWLPIVPVIKIFCFMAVLNVINTPSGISFQSLGKPQISTKISSVSLVILLIVVYPLSKYWGINGAAAALLSGTAITSPIIWFMTKRLIGITYTEYFSAAGVPLLITAIMVVCIELIRALYFSAMSITNTIILIGLSGTIFVIVLSGFIYIFKYDGHKLVIYLLDSIRGK